MWYNIHVLKGRTQRRSPGTRKAYKMKKYHVTIRPINGTWEYPYKTWSKAIYTYSKKRAAALALEELQKDYTISGDTVKIDVEIVEHKYQRMMRYGG